MTDHTPQQMRALAQRNEFTAREPGLYLESAAALRAAADQLDWLRAYVENNWAHGKFAERGKYLPLVDAGPLLESLTYGEQR